MSVWSIIFPNKRFFPPPSKHSWQYFTLQILYCYGWISYVLLPILDWNTWIIPNEIRLFIGVPIIVFGWLFAIWGGATVGVKNTVGLENGFVLKGPYLYTRNPQYLGNICLLTGMALIANSLYVAIINVLLSLLWFIVPFSEEIWLEEKYGEKYKQYKEQIPRFL